MASLTDVKMFEGGRVFIFDSSISDSDAAHYLFPGGVPSGVEIVGHEGREYAVMHLDMDTAAQLNQELLEMYVNAQPVGSGDWFPGAAPPPSAAGGARAKPRPPGYPSPDDPAAIKRWVDDAIEGTHYVAGALEIAEAFAGEALPEFLEAAAAALGPVGDVAMLIVLFADVIEAFGTGRRMLEAIGTCYGMCWQVFGFPDQKKKFMAWAPDTAEERESAFKDGVGEGRAKGADAKVYNALTLWVAREIGTGSDERTAQWKLLNELVKQALGDEAEGVAIQSWPKPDDDVP